MIRLGTVNKRKKAVSFTGKPLGMESAHAGEGGTGAHSHLIAFSQANNGSGSCDAHAFPQDMRPLVPAEQWCKKACVDKIEGTISKCQRLSNIHFLKTGIRELLRFSLSLSI